MFNKDKIINQLQLKKIMNKNNKQMEILMNKKNQVIQNTNNYWN